MAVYRYLKMSEHFSSNACFAKSGHLLSAVVETSVIHFFLASETDYNMLLLSTWNCSFCSCSPHMQQKVLVLLTSAMALDLFRLRKILILWLTASFITVICSSSWRKREPSSLQPSNLNTFRLRINLAPDSMLCSVFLRGRKPNEL